MAQFDNVLPIWGIQRMTELEEWLSYMDNPPAMTEEMEDINVWSIFRGDVL